MTMIAPPPPKRKILAGEYNVAGRGTSAVYADMDFETYSEAGFCWDEAKQKWQGPRNAAKGKKGLPVIGAANYAKHPSTEVLSLFYDLKDGNGPQFWCPGLPNPSDLILHVSSGKPIEAWNVAFEWWIWNEVCVKKYGWPPLRIRQTRDAVAKARAFSLPGKLEEAGEVLNIENKKLAKMGKSLLDRFSMPRNPTKKDPRMRIPVEGDPEQGNLYLYNLRDIEAEAEISARLPDTNEWEMNNWFLDQLINRRGVAMDIITIEACQSLLTQVYEKYFPRCKELCGASPTEVAQIKSWLHSQGYFTDDLDEEAIEALMKLGLPENVAEVLQIRLLVASASVKKVHAMRNLVNDGTGRMYDMYSYHGARTGRATAQGAQPANLPKAGPDVWKCIGCDGYHNTTGNECPYCYLEFDRSSKQQEWCPEAVEDAITVIQSGKLETVEYFFTKAFLTISGIIRGLFIAGPGRDLISSDYSAIEGVVIAALSNETWRLDVFRDHGMIYEMSAAKVMGIPFQEFVDYKKEHGKHHPMRQTIGKVGELASGFGGWINAWKQFGADKFLDGDEAIKEAILGWRRASPNIEFFWGGQRRNFKQEYFGLEGMAVLAIKNPGTEYEVFNRDGTTTNIRYVCHADVLYCILPSGRTIAYHHPRLESQSQAWRGDSITFWGYNTNPKNGPRGWIKMSTYSGKLAENVVQAVARDILMNAIQLLEARGYKVVLHTYDEIVAEVPEGFGSVEELEEIMASLPSWATGWPIRAAGGWRAKRYRKG